MYPFVYYIYADRSCAIHRVQAMCFARERACVLDKVNALTVGILQPLLIVIQDTFHQTCCGFTLMTLYSNQIPHPGLIRTQNRR